LGTNENDIQGVSDTVSVDGPGKAVLLSTMDGKHNWTTD
jgi:hypothetical protein